MYKFFCKTGTIFKGNLLLINYIKFKYKPHKQIEFAGENFMDKYVTIKLPKNLVDEIDNFVGKHGFVSRTEVVKEAIRRLLQQYNLQKRA
jgi:hypothetical protein